MSEAIEKFKDFSINQDAYSKYIDFNKLSSTYIRELPAHSHPFREIKVEVQEIIYEINQYSLIKETPEKMSKTQSYIIGAHIKQELWKLHKIIIESKKIIENPLKNIIFKL